MTNPIMYYDQDMADDNLLLAEDNIQLLIDAGILAALPTWNNTTDYVVGVNDIVYYLGIYYKAKVNINSGGGTPLANSNWVQISNWGGYNTTVSAAGTTVLTVYSEKIQRLTGTSNQTFTLPVVSTLPALGYPFVFINDSTGVATIQSSGANTVITLAAGERCTVNAVALTGTSAAVWSYTLIGLALTAQNLGNLIKGLTQKATPIDADRFGYWDSVADIAKYALGSDIKAWLKTYNDTLYDSIKSYQTIATAAGTSTLTLTSPSETFFTGSTTQNCDMPVASTLYTGWQRTIVNNSSGLVTVRSSGANTILTLAAGTSVRMICILASGTSAASWHYIYKGVNVATGKVFTINNSVIINGTDGTTHTLPATSSSLARTDAAQTLIGTQSIANYMQLSEIGGILMAQTLSADGKFSIIKGRIGTLGETISAVGTLVYYKASDSRWWRTDSDAAATSVDVPLALVCVTGNAGDDVQLMEEGVIRSDALFPTLTIGAPVYIGSSTGAVQVSKPTSGFIRVVGYGDTADALIFKPSNDYYEIGSYTPTITFGGGSTGMTFTFRPGYYIKHRDYYTASAFIYFSNKGSSTGNALITLPFAGSSRTRNDHPASLLLDDFNAIAGTVFATRPAATGSIYPYYLPAAGGVSVALNDTHFKSTSQFQFNIMVETV